MLLDSLLTIALPPKLHESSESFAQRVSTFKRVLAQSCLAAVSHTLARPDFFASGEHRSAARVSELNFALRVTQHLFENIVAFPKATKVRLPPSVPRLSEWRRRKSTTRSLAISCGASSQRSPTMRRSAHCSRRCSARCAPSSPASAPRCALTTSTPS